MPDIYPAWTSYDTTMRLGRHALAEVAPSPHRALQKAVRGLSPFPLAQACPGMQLLPNAAAAGRYRILMDIVQTLLNIVGRQLMPSRPPGRPSGTWRCLAPHLGSSAAHTALSGQLRPPKSRRRGLANGAGMRGVRITCISLPSSCISAAAGRELIVHPVSCNQEEKGGAHHEAQAHHQTRTP